MNLMMLDDDVDDGEGVDAFDDIMTLAQLQPCLVYLTHNIS